MRKILSFGIAGLASAFAAACSPDETPAIGAGACYVNMEISQSRFSLDFTQHLKDAANKTEFPLPVACPQKKTLRAGDNLVDKLRVGSLFLRGSLSEWTLKVKDVPALQETDQSSCPVTLRLHQKRYDLDIVAHFKDRTNTVDFKWNMPCTVYDRLKPGDNLIKDGFRVGSLVVDGSVSYWALSVLSKDKPVPKVQ